ncbi:MAG: type IV secretory system conjugative DNA transfer family protein [Lachnospiraceae bacterium]|nr:type IV secretory system conjugative DNA transfer family protein [Lachnospiraceae bacterium]
MHLKKLFRWLIESGIYLIPVGFGGAVYAWRGIPPNPPLSQEQYMLIGVASVLVWLWLWNEQTSSLSYLNKHDGREAAMYPRPPKDMTYRDPEGFCFGKYGSRYICKRVDEPGSIFIGGGSGSGKSTTLIESFLLNPKNKKNCTALVLDLKHELADDCVKPEDIYGSMNPDGDTIILDPLDRKTGFGYDPFFLLSDESSESEVHETMQVVTDAIIPLLKGDGAVWSGSARQFLTGAMTFFYHEKKLRTLPDIIEAMKAAPIADIVNMIIDSTVPGSLSYIDMISFKDQASETITSTDMNLSQKIVQLRTDQNLCWCLSDCPRKCSPKDLLTKSIFLCLPEDKLEEWGQLIFLIFSQSIKWMMSLPEKKYDPERKYMAMILDESVALQAGVGAAIPGLAQCLRIGARGKGCTMVVCCQSISGLYAVAGKDETKDMFSNLAYKYVLESSDIESNKTYIELSGKYSSRKASSNGSGKDRKINYSYKDEDIVRNEDLIKLPKSGDAILLSGRAGYLRLKKSPVYKDKFFKKLLKEVKKSKEEQKHE